MSQLAGGSLEIVCCYIAAPAANQLAVKLFIHVDSYINNVQTYNIQPLGTVQMSLQYTD